jgi:predicted Zn-dependent protease
MVKIEEVNKLMEDGFNAAYSGSYDDAIKIGKKLIGLRHSSGFEILALGLQGNGENKKAIKVLEDGLKKVPKVFKLWQLLGNLYSDCKMYTKAYRAYENGLQCTDTDHNSIFLNYSIALNRDNNVLKALETLHKINIVNCDDSLKVSFWAIKLNIQNKMQDFKKCIADYILINGLVNNSNSEKLLNAKEYISSLHYEYAYALHKTGSDKNDILKAIDKAISENKHNEEIKWLIREIRGAFSIESKHYSVNIEGIWLFEHDENGSAPGFLTHYDVVADDETEAIQYIKQFEPVEIRDTIKIQEFKIVKKLPNTHKGVYSTTGYIFYNTGT